MKTLDYNLAPHIEFLYGKKTISLLFELNVWNVSTLTRV